MSMMYTNGHRNGNLNGQHNGQQNGTAETLVRTMASEHAAIGRKAVIEDATRAILAAVGEDPGRDGLLGTPDRVARMYDELLAGYQVDPIELVNNALFDVDYAEMVVVKDIEFYSLCEHHMLPFFGRAHVAYIPDGQVIGLSKIPRLVDMFARRLQIQERMTNEIAQIIDEIIAPLGVAVVVEGSHMCSMMRGVKKEHSRMITSAMVGQFKTDRDLRQDFMRQLSSGQLISLF